MDTRQIAIILKTRSSSPDIRRLSDALIEVLGIRSDTLEKSVELIEKNLKRRLSTLKGKSKIEREE